MTVTNTRQDKMATLKDTSLPGSELSVKGTRGGKSHIPEVVVVILHYCGTC